MKKSQASQRISQLQSSLLDVVYQYDKEFHRLNTQDANRQKELKIAQKEGVLYRAEVERLQAELHSLRQNRAFKVVNAATKPKTVYSKIQRSLKKTDNPDVEPIYKGIESTLEAHARTRKNTIAVVLHLYYPDMWESDFKETLERLYKTVPFDLYVNVQTGKLAVAKHIKDTFDNAFVYETPNKGRDILPFIRSARILNRSGYEAVLKVHSKRSPQRIDGHQWLSDMLNKLVPESKVLLAEMSASITSGDAGLIGPSEHFLALPVSAQSKHENTPALRDIFRRVYADDGDNFLGRAWLENGFFEGSMFWINLKAIEPVLEAVFESDRYDSEQGQTDGTYAHAVERALSLIPEINGRHMYETDGRHLTSIENNTNFYPAWSDLFEGEQIKITRD